LGAVNDLPVFFLDISRWNLVAHEKKISGYPSPLDPASSLRVCFFPFDDVKPNQVSFLLLFEFRYECTRNVLQYGPLAPPPPPVRCLIFRFWSDFPTYFDFQVTVELASSLVLAFVGDGSGLPLPAGIRLCVVRVVVVMVFPLFAHRSCTPPFRQGFGSH